MGYDKKLLNDDFLKGYVKGLLSHYKTNGMDKSILIQCLVEITSRKKAAKIIKLMKKHNLIDVDKERRVWLS